jgi:hypothetical protein
MTRLTLLVASVGLFACGPGAKVAGKEGATQALFAASSASLSAPGGTTASPAIGNFFQCPHGGKASLAAYSVDVSGANLAQGATLRYENCGAAKADVGVAVLNGDMKIAQNIMTGAQGSKVSQKFEGRLLMQGAFDDFLEANITQEVDVSSVGSTGPAVAVMLKGTLTTSSGTYTYDEAVTVDASTINAQVTRR